MRNKNGYALFELVVSLSFVFIVIVNILNVTILLSKKVTNIYSSNNINNTINLVSNNIGEDLYSNIGDVSCDAGSVIIDEKEITIDDGILKYDGNEYKNKNIKFNSVSCEEKDGYYKVNINYNDDVINLYSLKNVG